jgi:tetratricopeptide (TPR) repeat protein
MKPSSSALITAAALLAACVSPSYVAFDDGVRLYQERYYTSARDAFDTAVQQNPRSVPAWNNRAVARARLGDHDGAVRDYSQALALAPADAELYFNRGNAFAAAGNHEAAIGDFTAATTLRPGYARAYFNRGIVRVAAGDDSGAITDWQRAVDLEPDPWTKAAIRRGSGLDHASALPAPAALPAPRTSVAVSPAVTPPPPPPTSQALSPEALDVRALVARAMGREVDGDRAGAIADLRAAVTLEPDATRRARIDRLLRVLEASR